jgi:lysophospholipase L1-like esterase
MTRRWREAAQQVGLAVLSVGVALLLAEVVVRATGLVPEHALVGARLADARFTVLLDCYPSNPRSYFDIDLRTPENRARYSHVAPNRYGSVSARAPYAVESRYNSLRFRERPFADLPSGKTRVALLGDSFTEGQGVKEAETATRVLGRLLEAREPGKFDVVSCGRRGDDFPKLLETLDDCLLAEPDVVVYLMVLNDAEQSPEFRKRQTFVNDWILLRGHDEEATAPTFFQSRLVDLVKGRLDALRVGRETTRWYREMYDEPNRAGWEHTQGYLREMDRRLRAQGRRFGVGLWPLFVGLEGGYPFLSAHEAIQASCTAARIPFVDLRRAFAGSRTADLWVHPLDHHPNEHAHAAAARALVEPVISLVPRT